MTAAAPARAPRISGYAARFDVLSSDLGGFIEVVRPGTFTSVLSDDVRALINHEPSLVLGRTGPGTLELRQDATGLAILCYPPDTTYANDLMECLRRGDISQMSFSFLVGRDRWSHRPDGLMLRELVRADRLFDVSVVTYPAYEATAALLRRSMDSVTPAGPERRGLTPSALRRGIAAALAEARCRCGAPAVSLEVEWRGETPRGTGRCARHLAAEVRTPRTTTTPRLDAARRRQRLRELEIILREATA